MTQPITLAATASYRIAVRYFSTSYVLCSRRPNIERPRIPGTERRILDAVSVPILPPDTRPLPQQCFDAIQLKRQANTSELDAAYLEFRLQQAIKMFNDNTMVVICHSIPLIPRDAFKVKAKIVTAGMKLMFARNDLAQKAIAGTRLQNLEPFLVSNNVYIVSDKNMISELVALLKKTPELQLLGGLVEDRILSRDDILNLTKLPPLDTMRGELLSILSASASTTSRHLSAHQEELSNNLDQLVKQSGDSKGEEESVN